MNDIQALKDPYYRRAQGLDSANHPAGPVELKDEELNEVNGGIPPLVAGAVVASFRFCHHAAKAVPAVVSGARWVYNKFKGRK